MKRKSAQPSVKAKRIAVFCSGSGTNLQALIRAQKSGKFAGTIALVVCDKASAYALIRANRADIPAALIEKKNFKNHRLFERAILAVLRQYRIHTVVLAGFMKILTADFIRQLKGRVINIHPSLLPSFKGAHAVKDAFEHGVKVTGVTVHMATADLDDGPILAQQQVTIDPSDRLEDVFEKIHRVEHRIYPQTVSKYLQGRFRIRGRKVKEII